MFTVGHLYLIFLILGGFGLLSSLIFGDMDADGDLDINAEGTDSGDADGPKVFSLRIIFAFLMAFGIGAGSMYLLTRGLGAQLITGFLAGIVTAVGTFYLMKLIYSFQGNSNVNANNFIGKTGMVTIGTTESGLCQVKINSNGADNLIMAREKSNKKLKKGNMVTVSEKMGNSFIVEKQ